MQRLGLAERFREPVDNDILVLFTNKVDAEFSTIDDQYALVSGQVEGYRIDEFDVYDIG